MPLITIPFLVFSIRRAKIRKKEEVTRYRYKAQGRFKSEGREIRKTRSKGKGS
jgi:hypothetical protein